MQLQRRTSPTTCLGVFALREPQNPASNPNPNCIANAVAGGMLGTTRGLIPGQRFVPGRGAVPTGRAAHDGIHVYAPPGDPAAVTALPAMGGQILHSGRQSDNRRRPDYNLGLLDILLDSRINGQQLASSGWKGRPKDVSVRADAAGIYRAGRRTQSSLEFCCR
jgi:hypothetical protein